MQTIVKFFSNKSFFYLYIFYRIFILCNLIFLYKNVKKEEIYTFNENNNFSCGIKRIHFIDAFVYYVEYVIKLKLSNLFIYYFFSFLFYYTFL